MQLSSGETTPRPRPDVQETVRRIRDLTRELDELRELEEGSGGKHESALKTEEREHQEASAKLEQSFRNKLRSTRNREFDGRQEFADTKHLRKKRIARAAERVRDTLEAQLDEERRRADREITRIQEELGEETDRRRTPVEIRMNRWEGLLPQVRTHHQKTDSALREFAIRHGVARGEVDPWSAEVDVEADPDRTAEEARDGFESVRARAERAGARWSAGFARSGHMILYQILLWLFGLGAALIAIRMGLDPVRAAIGLGALVLLTAVLHLVSRSVRRKLGRTIGELNQEATHHAQRFERHAKEGKDHLDTLYLEGSEAHARKVSRAEEEVRAKRRGRTADTRRRLGELEGRRVRAESGMARRHSDRVARLDGVEERAGKELRAAHEAEKARQEEAHRERLAVIETEAAELDREVRERRESAVSGFTAWAGAIREAVEERHRPWDEIDPERIVLPTEFPEFVPFGRLGVSLGDDGEAHLPVTTTFPDHGSLLVQHRPEDRGRAIDILSNTILRALASFPAGKVRLTVLDPVGLGQSFSALMHLADHDEDLVSGRIWTESLHIERQLGDLTEHIEKVIQKYLRNRYLTIGEYNVEAGELQEPYHLLVVADFPTAFNELATERLASIVASGPRCGVYTLIAHDVRQEVPPPLDLGLISRNGPALSFGPDGCRLAGAEGDTIELLPEAPPDPDMTSRMLDRIGRLSVDAAHIELPFSAVTPEEKDIWTGSTRKGVRVPVGRTGAERLQYLDLGRGTAQHALIAGRTGSGKSTLFHVMITNMSLWMSPDEIEFYLIDFKKGVEFKPYATHRLPHARVVAIESDREFGLSVLRAIDAELSRRGDLFRARGVQDLAAYRASGAEEALPRTLLLIDEFQEFFTEDDTVAHDSALLLDRFVRQGRAFGIHVVLGSQTLSGIYTLARGTLGQMGVRIALQCNEADSYLILSEDNGVARLLSRPGEAIYNDKSGLLEGNNPFQVVWLSEGEQRRSLRLLTERAAASPEHGERPIVVFEGKKPAPLHANPDQETLVAIRVPGEAGD